MDGDGVRQISDDLYLMLIRPFQHVWTLALSKMALPGLTEPSFPLYMSTTSNFKAGSAARHTEAGRSPWNRPFRSCGTPLLLPPAASKLTVLERDVPCSSSELYFMCNLSRFKVGLSGYPRVNPIASDAVAHRASGYFSYSLAIALLNHTHQFRCTHQYVDSSLRVPLIAENTVLVVPYFRSTLCFLRKHFCEAGHSAAGRCGRVSLPGTFEPAETMPSNEPVPARLPSLPTSPAVIVHSGVGEQSPCNHASMSLSQGKFQKAVPVP